MTDFWKRLRALTPQYKHDDTARTKYAQKVCAVSQATASRWKTGGTSGKDRPSPKHTLMLCADLNASFDYLYNGDEQNGKLIVAPGSRSEELMLILNALPENEKVRAKAILQAIADSPVPEPQPS